MLVIGDEHDRVWPVRTIADGVEDSGHENLAGTNVGARTGSRVLVVFRGRVEESEVRVDEGHGWQRAGLRILEERVERIRRQLDGAGLTDEAEVRRVSQEGPEARGLRHILIVVRPGDAVLIEQIEDRAGERSIKQKRRLRDIRDLFTRDEVAERGAGHQERAIREGGTEDGTEVAIGQCKDLGHVVVEAEIVLVVEAHGLIVRQALYEVVRLVGEVVDQYESVV